MTVAYERQRSGLFVPTSNGFLNRIRFRKTGSISFTMPSWIKPNTLMKYAVLGGGGGGAWVIEGSTYSNKPSAGAGGALCIGFATVNPGDSLTGTVGAGGASIQKVATGASIYSAAGNSGGTSTLSLNSTQIGQSTGGAGGTVVTYTTTQTAAAGGTATGGLINSAGGAGGLIPLPPSGYGNGWTCAPPGGGSSGTPHSDGYQGGAGDYYDYGGSAGIAGSGAGWGGVGGTGLAYGSSGYWSGAPGASATLPGSTPQGNGYMTYSTYQTYAFIPGIAGTEPNEMSGPSAWMGGVPGPGVIGHQPTTGKWWDLREIGGASGGQMATANSGGYVCDSGDGAGATSWMQFNTPARQVRAGFGGGAAGSVGNANYAFFYRNNSWASTTTYSYLPVSLPGRGGGGGAIYCSQNTAANSTYNSCPGGDGEIILWF